MKKEYIKPLTMVSELAIDECVMLILSGQADSGRGVDSKRRERWEEGQDLWGNDCWNRVD